MSKLVGLSPAVTISPADASWSELVGPSGSLVVPADFVKSLPVGGASPSNAVDDGRLLQKLADGGFLAVTAYENDTPLATLVPGVDPLKSMPVDALPTTAYRLSRFAYLHRAMRAMLIEIPTTSAYLEIHDPRVAAIAAGLAFDQTPVALASASGLSVSGVCEVLGLMRSIGIAVPVVRGLEFVPAVKSLVDWAQREALPSGFSHSGLVVGLDQIPVDGADASFHLIFELHHDGSRQVDISVCLPYSGPGTSGDRAVLSSTGFYEFDVVDGVESLMGVFIHLLPPTDLIAQDDQVQRLDEALRALGTNCQASSNLAARELVVALGLPAMLAALPGREDAVRMLFSIPDLAALSLARKVLLDAGLPVASLAHFGAIETLIGGVASVRIAVDLTETGLGQRIGFEVFDPQAIAMLATVLPTLGVDPRMQASVLAAVSEPSKERTVYQTNLDGSITDVPVALQRIGLLHVKIGLEQDGQVAVKTYSIAASKPLNEVGKSVEDELIPRSWEFHDLLFHTKTRNGRVRGKLGGTIRFTLMPHPAEPSTQPVPGDILLPTVDIPALIAADPPFGKVLEERKSIRAWDGAELPVAQVSELLARVMHLVPRSDEVGGQVIERSGRVYPSGGALYEIDIVLFANRVAGLAPGAYLYRQGSHSLGALTGDIAKQERVLFAASEATGAGMSRPQALIVLAARFPDIATKYEGIAYSLMLKHVGVMMATIQFSATAMGIGSVPLGTGDSDAFALATGLDYYTQGSIGEIAISPME